MKRESLLIAFEGPDGSGKATQAKALQRNFKERYQIESLLLSFPQYHTSQTGEQVGKMLHGEFGDFSSIHPYLTADKFSVDRLAALPLIQQAQMEGKFIICDRWSDSNIHQAARLSTWEEKHKFLEYYRWIEQTIMRLPKADKVIFLDVPVEISLENLNKRGKRDQVEGDAAYLRAALELYRKVAAVNSDWIRINCMENNEKMRDEAEIQHEILEGLCRHKVLPN